ncbi:histidinol-phosphate transaminase [Paraburkholderia sp. ZP32-5]|uniref:histidinol-phosphate transaminase n=1 Tax=Paraburkholderia sp. ZP32-5 TaxID=2883245 RepID=UPI001F46BB6D|nr:histidinol-phosphate transaminase [Paraburkholderia sp. ZP32-5]
MSEFLTQCAPHILDIPPYVAGRPVSDVMREFGLERSTIVKLASNENPLGMPPLAKAAIAAALEEASRYPDSNGHDLKQALAAAYSVDAACITLGNGSHDLLEMAAHAVLHPGLSAVYSQYAFVVYGNATQACGAEHIVVPVDSQMGHDLDAMLAAIKPNTRLMFVANPNNPTGTFIAGSKIEAFLEKVPPHIIVVLDEAYTEYLSDGDRYDSLHWIERFPNLCVTRTFSKAFGLAGLRVGFGVASPTLTGLLNRLRPAFNVNSLAQAAAIAALSDHDFLERSRTINLQGLERLGKAFDELGLAYVRSHGNFVMVKVGEEKEAGQRVNGALMRRGVIVRPLASYGLPQWLRVTVGTPEENTRFIEELSSIVESIRAA